MANIAFLKKPRCQVPIFSPFLKFKKPTILNIQIQTLTTLREIIG